MEFCTMGHVLLLAEKKFLLNWLDGKVILRHIYVIIVATLSFVIFNGENLSQILSDFSCMFGLTKLPLFNAETLYYLKHYGATLVIAIIGATPVVKNIAMKTGKIKAIEPVVLLMLMIVITAYLIDGSFNPFLYFRF